jgi:hypothetical protein
MHDRDIGRHEEAIDNLKTEVQALRSDIAEIKTILATAKGGWRTLMAIGSLAGVIGAGIMKIFGIAKGGGI